MPNWCVQNWILRGPKEDIQCFCDKVNTCLTRPGRENGFGKYWLGNLCECFGYDYDKLKEQACPGLRGIFCPCPDEVACLSCPEAEETPIEPIDFDEYSEIAFSVAHAWGPSNWFQNMLDEQFPTLTQCWKATDEFGNFHACHNGDAFGLKRYQILAWDKEEDEGNFAEGEEQQAVDFIKRASDGLLDFTPEELNEGDEFYEKLNDYNDDHDYIEVMFWEEE